MVDFDIFIFLIKCENIYIYIYIVAAEKTKGGRRS